MKKYLYLLLLLAIKPFTAFTQAKVTIVKFNWYQNMRECDNDTTYIINFWATWCIPCVAELPVFEQLNAQYAHEKVRIILVSLDAIKRKEIVLEPFISKKAIQSSVVLLNEPNYNNWIDKVDINWQGSLPATVVFNNQKQLYHFFENSITFEQLQQLILKK